MRDVQIPSDEARQRLGFLPIAETAALAHRGVVIPDPASVLVSSDTRLEKGVILWPGVILQVLEGGDIVIGDDTQLFPGSRLVASGGSIKVGACAEIGEEGGFTLKAEARDLIEIGDGARLLGGGSLILSNRVGRGAQIVGPIRCQNCTLGDGGTYRDPEPDERGAVLKGSGVARNIDVPTGCVIQAFGLFSEGVIRQQSYFHPKPAG
ncbi:hypothetical protein VB618_16590 [Microvirga sp. CF3062]|uniref:hypothetical protein n=1 Tax=Microvirga sp. CF3062 TaxID=3110182 RepID=UPI002E794B5D|nr:hypothetical protein [Microvirga sp. CF3062]MEE1657821.1 hypothetical protein [Microvirga sp. CF3062]